MPPPLTFCDCFEDGRADVAKFMIFNEVMNEEEEEEMFETQYFSTNNKRKCSGQEGNVISSTKKAWSTKKYIFYCRADDGTLREATFKDSSRYRLCIEYSPVRKRLLKIFHNRFRIPCGTFVSMHEDAKNNDEVCVPNRVR